MIVPCTVRLSYLPVLREILYLSNFLASRTLSCTRTSSGRGSCPPPELPRLEDVALYPNVLGVRTFVGKARKCQTTTVSQLPRPEEVALYLNFLGVRKLSSIQTSSPRGS